MINQVVSINRKKYAVGLFWQPVGAGFVARNYARNLSRTVDKKLNLYTEYRAMVGLGARRMGHKSGMLSIAAEVMEALAEYTSFLSVFAAGKNFVLVAVRNGVILEDKLFDTEAAARKAYTKLSQIPDWGVLIAPGAWGMPRAIERNLGDIVSGNSRSNLHTISRFGAGMMSVLMIVLFGVLLLWAFRDQIGQMMAPRPQMANVDPEIVAEYKRQVEEKNKELDTQFEIEKPVPPAPIVMPYEALPNPVARAEQCYQAIGFLMQPIVGWNQVFAECGETHASVEIRRGFGTLGEFYNVATELMPGAFVTEVSENLLKVRAKLPQIPTVASQDERDAETIVRDITTKFQAIDTDFESEIVVDTLTNGVETATLNIVEIAASSKMVPMQFMQIFEDFGGVYMTGCTWDTSSRTWNYEVIIYAK